MKDKIFMHLYPSGLNTVDLEIGLGFDANEKICHECGAPMPGAERLVVHVMSTPSLKSPLCFLNGYLLTVIRKDFAKSLNIDCSKRNKSIGEIWSKGSAQDEWVTFYTEDRPIVRGSENAAHRLCTTCGRVIYFALGRKYLCSAPVGSGPYATPLAGVIFEKNLVDANLLKGLKGVYVDRLSITDHPADGFSIDLSN